MSGRVRAFFGRLWAKRWARTALIAFAVLVPIGTAGGVAGFRYIKTDPDFCVKCHLMDTPGEKWKHSAHKDVICQTCHRANIFEEAEMGFNAFVVRPKEVRPHAKLSITICQECHMSDDKRWKQIGSTPGHAGHFVGRGISCLDCHVQKLHEFAPSVNACKRCHDSKEMHLEKMEDVHCFKCHDFLGKITNKLVPSTATCRQCHTEQKNPIPKGHDDCTDCHKPHGDKHKDPIDCLQCHTKLLAPTERHFKDWRLQNCRTCHEPHGKTPTVLAAVQPIPDDAGPLQGRYAGEQTCRRCHFAHHKSWNDTAHADAFQILPTKYKNDATCTSCHATGQGQPGGFASLEKTPAMASVQCEACHGPAAEHAAYAKEHEKDRDVPAVKSILIGDHLPPERQCIRCHLPQRHGNHPAYEKEPGK
jgi:nitrate/TMAO reductase-like tetraheme cytochrome c subunit